MRQTTGFFETLLFLTGLNWKAPDSSTLSRRLKTLAVNITRRGTQGELHLLIESKGIKLQWKGAWNSRKHCGSQRRVWRKFHLEIGEKTQEIREVEATGNEVRHAPRCLN